MAVIVSKANGNLSAANNFYRAEAYNLGARSSTALDLVTPRIIAFTPANAGNALGVDVVVQTPSPAIAKTIDAHLQEIKGACTMDITTERCTYPWSSGFGAKYSNPGTLPTDTGYEVAFSPSPPVPSAGGNFFILF